MRLTLKIFAFLDLISLVFLGMQILAIYQSGGLATETDIRIKFASFIVCFLLLGIGIYGLWFAKKAGFIAYYVQFPFRLWLWIFSIGFITLLPEAFNLYEDYWFDWLFRLCVIAEFFRLYFTVQAHRKLSRR